VCFLFHQSATANFTSRNFSGTIQKSRRNAGRRGRSKGMRPVRRGSVLECCGAPQLCRRDAGRRFALKSESAPGPAKRSKTTALHNAPAFRWSAMAHPRTFPETAPCSAPAMRQNVHFWHTSMGHVSHFGAFPMGVTLPKNQ